MDEGADVGQLAAAVSELAHVVGAQGERLDELAFALTAPHYAREPVYDGLRDWVDWLRERYQLGARIPITWTNSGAMVEELSALESAWRASFGPRSRPQDPIWWHEAFARALSRYPGWLSDAAKRAGLGAAPTRPFPPPTAPHRKDRTG